MIDDGSKDDTPRLVRQRYKDAPRIRYVTQENRGVAAARNRALDMAQGEYIAFLDSDDYWEPWKLRAQLACFAHCPEVGVVWTDMQAVEPGGAVMFPRYLRKMYSAYRYYPEETLFRAKYRLADIAPDLFHAPSGELTAEARKSLQDVAFYTGTIFPQMVRGNLVHTSTVLMRRERVRQTGRFDLSFHNIGEDYDYHLRASRLGPVGYLDTASVCYQVQAEDQLTHSSLHLGAARNFLIVAERELRNVETRRALGEDVAMQTLAEAHAWIGQELLMRGDTKGARQHLRQALEFDAACPDARRNLAVAALPSSVYVAARGFYRRVRYGQNSSAPK